MENKYKPKQPSWTEKFRLLSLKEQIELINLLTILTVEQAAILLQCSTDTVYSLCHFPDGQDGTLPHIHHGNAIRIPRQLLEFWVINQTKGISANELMDFRQGYINNIGIGKAIDTQKGETL